MAFLIKYSFLISLLAASVTSLFADTGTSHNLFYRNKIDANKYIVGRANLVTRDGFNDLFFGYVDANIGLKLNSRWSFEAGYRHAQLQLVSGWRREYRPHLNLSYRTKWDTWQVRNRHRLEFRYFEGDANDHIRYRNESVFTSPHKLTRYQLTPYLSEEFFYEFTDNDLNINWLTLGVSRTISKNKKWKLGYRLQSQIFNGKWSNRHVLVTGFSIPNFNITSSANAFSAVELLRNRSS